MNSVRENIIRYVRHVQLICQYITNFITILGSRHSCFIWGPKIFPFLSLNWFIFLTHIISLKRWWYWLTISPHCFEKTPYLFVDLYFAGHCAGIWVWRTKYFARGSWYFSSGIGMNTPHLQVLFKLITKHIFEIACKSTSLPAIKSSSSSSCYNSQYNARQKHSCRERLLFASQLETE